ncbi:TPA: hypothetical protein L5F73_003038 [Pseudomonas aeruginosa]|nr:hypothetical protein [Pseudomonas aeruginosa]HBO9679665.1 hypothetical protein [Pseudomonas aeruginosa]
MHSKSVDSLSLTRAGFIEYFLVATKLVHALTAIAPALFLLYYPGLVPVELRSNMLGLLLFFGALTVIMFQALDVYSDDIFSNRLRFRIMFFAWASAFCLLLFMYQGLGLFPYLSSKLVIFWFTGSLLLFGVQRLLVLRLYRAWMKRGMYLQRTVILGFTESGMHLAEYLVRNHDIRSGIIGFIDDRSERVPENYNSLPLLGNTKDLEKLIRQEQVDQVLVALPWFAEGRIGAIVHRLRQLPVNVLLVPDMAAFRHAHNRIVDVSGIPMFNASELPLRGWSPLIKSYKAQILKHLNEIGASSIEDRLQDLSERINVLRGERFNSIRLIASSDSALESTRQQLKGLPREIVTVRQIALNPAQQDLRRLLNQKRLERADMMRTYTDDAPPVKALDASIRALEKEVQDEGATVQSSEDRAPNTLTTHLERVLLDETSNNAALRTQLAEQEKQLAELEAQRREALDIEPTLARLQRELNATERNYALYVDSLEKSRIDRELDKSQISNISVIEEATYNPGRIFPKTLLMLFLAVPFGLAVGLLVVYLCYLLDQRIHDGGLVEEKFGLPLWTTLPELSNSTAESSNAFTASIYRLYGLLPYARIEEKGLTLGLTSARHGEGVTFIIEQLRRLLEENGVRVRVGGEPAQPGEVVLLDAPALLDSREAFIALRRADLIALVVEAQKSTVPVVEHALTILTTAFGKVDGIIINRRRFEVPSKVLQTIARYRSAF